MNAKRIVVKVGTSTLTYDNGKMNIRRMEELVRVLSDLKNSGLEVVLVTSAAVAVGVSKLRLPSRPKDVMGRQAAASVGQSELMFMYDKLFDEYHHTIAQLLITRGDVEVEDRRNNLINTFSKLFEFGAIPIINENDSVCTEELVFGDNDTLSAIVARLVDADTLIMLTDIDGLYSSDPRIDPNATLIPVVETIDDSIASIAGSNGTERGTGGMMTKISAARISTAAGIDTYIINGDHPTNIYKIMDGEAIGTCFKACR
ncbi:MAG: glutamate 5-kinase [Clostridia bacterium]|nr:glutamate 5-kinase [Clostridia bacterium]